MLLGFTSNKLLMTLPSITDWEMCGWFCAIALIPIWINHRQSIFALKMESLDITINSTEFPSVDFSTSMTARLPPTVSASTDRLIHDPSGIRATMLRAKMTALFHFRAPPMIPMRGIKSDKTPRWCWICAITELQYSISELRSRGMIH